jgi:hypothetical protein
MPPEAVLIETTSHVIQELDFHAAHEHWCQGCQVWAYLPVGVVPQDVADLRAGDLDDCQDSIWCWVYPAYTLTDATRAPDQDDQGLHCWHITYHLEQRDQ